MKRTLRAILCCIQRPAWIRRKSSATFQIRVCKLSMLIGMGRGQWIWQLDQRLNSYSHLRTQRHMISSKTNRPMVILCKSAFARMIWTERQPPLHKTMRLSMQESEKSKRKMAVYSIKPSSSTESKRRTSLTQPTEANLDSLALLVNRK